MYTTLKLIYYGTVYKIYLLLLPIKLKLYSSSFLINLVHIKYKITSSLKFFISTTFINFVTSLDLVNLIIIIITLKISYLLTSNSRYNYTKSVILLLLLTYLSLNELNLTFWFFFIALAELTSVYLVSLILVNYTSLNKKFININFVLALILVNYSNKVISFDWFNLLSNFESQISTLSVLKHSIINPQILYTLVLLLWVITVFLLISLLVTTYYSKYLNILDYVYKTKILINTTNDSLNLFLKDFIVKWKNN